MKTTRLEQADASSEIEHGILRAFRRQRALHVAFVVDLSLIQTHLSDLKTKADTALALTGNYLYAVSRFVYTALNKTSLGKGKMTEQTAYMKERFALKKKGQPSATAPVTE